MLHRPISLAPAFRNALSFFFGAEAPEFAALRARQTQTLYPKRHNRCGRGEYDHHKWDYLVEAGDLERRSPRVVDIVAYVLSEMGSDALCN